MPNRPVREVMSRHEALCCTPSDSVQAACRLMLDNKCGSILVREDERLVGIFTERDLIRVVAEAGNPGKTTLHDVMSHNPATIEADSTVKDAIRAMDEGEIRYLPVLDKGRLVGVVSARDLPPLEIGELGEELDERHQLKERLW